MKPLINNRMLAKQKWVICIKVQIQSMGLPILFALFCSAWELRIRREARYINYISNPFLINFITNAKWMHIMQEYGIYKCIASTRRKIIIPEIWWNLIYKSGETLPCKLLLLIVSSTTLFVIPTGHMLYFISMSYNFLHARSQPYKHEAFWSSLKKQKTASWYQDQCWYDI